MLANARVVALLLALSVAVITTSFLTLVEGISLITLILCFVLSFSSSYILSFITLEFFIFGEINKIYDRLNALKSENLSRIQFEQRRRGGSNPISKINDEIFTYAEVKQREIEELKRSEEFRRQFIADISHELKTPIFAAQGFVHTLLDGAVKDKTVRTKFLKKAAKSLDGLDTLVQDLLTISQMETGTIKMQFSHFNLYKLICEVFDQFESKADKKDIQLMMDANIDKEAFVCADEEKIYRVLLNLISNALKYKREEEASFVTINAQRTGDGWVEVNVADNGVGIPKEDIMRIFERFYRVDKSRSKDKGGTGLGLSIVKHVLEKHNSNIKVISQVGKGSVFYFKLKEGKPEEIGMELEKTAKP